MRIRAERVSWISSSKNYIYLNVTERLSNQTQGQFTMIEIQLGLIFNSIYLCQLYNVISSDDGLLTTESLTQ